MRWPWWRPRREDDDIRQSTADATAEAQRKLAETERMGQELSVAVNHLDAWLRENHFTNLINDALGRHR